MHQTTSLVNIATREFINEGGERPGNTAQYMQAIQVGFSYPLSIAKS